MKAKFILIFIMTALMVPAFGAKAQDLSDERQKQIEEMIGQSVERMEEILKLEDWQTFYLDSILMHDYTYMYQELEELQQRKATNTDLYYQIQDKWQDQIYDAVHKVLNEDQWAKYLKVGAAKEKKEREKRAAKRLKSS